MANQNTPTSKEEVETPTVSTEEALTYLQEHGTDRLRDQLTSSHTVVPIELAKALEIRPQMVYNYIRDGRIAAHETADTQHLVIKEDVAVEFVRVRLEREAQKAVKVQRELAGSKTA